MLEKDILKALIIDDEKPARRDMRRILEKVEGVEIVGEAVNGIEAVDGIRELAPDLVLLDIQMPGLDGFQVIERLSGMDDLPSIIFITAYDQYALKAFEVHAVDYILKPVDEKRLAEAVDRIRRIRRGVEAAPDIEGLLRTIQAAPKRLALRHDDSLVLVDVEDILYATVSEGDILVVTRDLEGTARFRSLDELQRELGGDRFVRVHRSYIANLNGIYEITPWFSGRYRLRMGGRDGPVIPLSRAQAGKLREILKW